MAGDQDNLHSKF